MKHLSAVFLLPFFLICRPAILFAQDNTHHNMKIHLYPEKHLIEVEDRITLPETLFPANSNKIDFILFKGLQPVSTTPKTKIIRLKDTAQHDIGIPPIPPYKGGDNPLFPPLQRGKGGFSQV